MTNLDDLVATLASALHINATEVISAVEQAKPTDFVPLVTLREADYRAVQAKIHDLPGTVFRTGTQLAGPSRHFAQPLLGQVGKPTAEALHLAGPGYLPTDQIGLSGLQQVFNSQLAGAASATIEIHDTQGNTVAQVGQFAGHLGSPLHTALDTRVQQAAETALSGVGLHAAIVALRPSTGDILAVANSDSAPFDIALAGQYPPGSTFKIVTASAVLSSGVAQPDSPVPCPGTVTIDGRTIPNEDAFNLGTVSLTDAFAHSCNTSFALLSQKLPPGALDQVAAEYGFEAGWQLPVNCFSGSYTPAKDGAGQAANAFGQGTDLVSPLSEALMAATVAHGSTPAPVLVAGQPASAKQPPPSPPAAVLASLSSFMRAVVPVERRRIWLACPVARCSARPAPPSTAAPHRRRPIPGSPATRATSLSPCSSRTGRPAVCPPIPSRRSSSPHCTRCADPPDNLRVAASVGRHHSPADHFAGEACRCRPWGSSRRR